MSKFNKIFLFFNAVVISVVVIVMVMVAEANAWTSPSGTPPTGGGAIYYSGGNVGIGTASPAHKLSILGTSGYGNMEFNNDVTGTFIQSYDRATSAYKPFRIITSATAGFYQNASGNVGIGTASPGYKIDGQANAADWGFRFQNTAGVNDYMYLAHGTYGVHIRNDSAPAGNYLLDVYPSNGSRFQVMGDGKVNINNSVGIKTAASGYSLDVAGGAWNSIARIYSTGGSSGIEFYDTAVRRGVVYSDSSGFGLLNNATSWALRVNQATTDIYMPGGVGIGADPSASYKLVVGGNIYSTGNLYLSNLTAPYLYNDGTYIKSSGYLRAASGIYSDGWVESGPGALMYSGGNLVQAQNYVIYPGSISGLGEWQTSYYLASHATWGIYTNTSFNAAGGVYSNGSPVITGIEFGTCTRGKTDYIDFLTACEWRVCYYGGCSSWYTGDNRIIRPDPTRPQYW